MYEQLADVFSSETRDARVLTLKLIYHVGFGEIGRVRAIIDTLLRLAGESDDVTAASLERKCAVALWRIGNAREATRVLEGVYRKAEKAGLEKLRLAAASMLASTLTTLGDAASVGWEQIVISIGAEDPRWRSEPSYFALLGERAICRGDTESLEMNVSFGLLNEGAAHGLGIGRWIRVAQMRLRQLRGDDPSPSELQSLVLGHKIDREYGETSDLEALTLAEGLRRRGEPHEAIGVIRRYLGQYRRGRSPLFPPLAELVKRLKDEFPTAWQSGDSDSAPAETPIKISLSMLDPLAGAPHENAIDS